MSNVRQQSKSEIRARMGAVGLPAVTHQSLFGKIVHVSDVYTTRPGLQWVDITYRKKGGRVYTMATIVYPPTNNQL